MNHPLQNINYENQELRMTDIDGEPHWVAKDVCDILEIQNTTQALQSLDSDERTMLSIGRGGETNLVNEAGLYHLIFKSKTDQAKEFRRWVTHEVLPQLRRQGFYMSPNLTSAEREIMALEYLIEAKKLQIEAKLFESKARLVHRIEDGVAIIDWLREQFPDLNTKQLANESRAVKRVLCLQLRKPVGKIKRKGGGQASAAHAADIAEAVALLRETRNQLKG